MEQIARGQIVRVGVDLAKHVIQVHAVDGAGRVVPSQNSRGGRASLGGITKRGDNYLRTLLIQGAKSAVMTAHKRRDRISRWLVQLVARVGWQKAAVALANKNARILWSVLAKGRRFDANHASVKPDGPAMVVPTMAG